MKRLSLALLAIVVSIQAASTQTATEGSVVHVPASEVSAALAKGRPLVETAGYKVHASRRDGPGIAELHRRDTDVFYVLEGAATIVTGGEVVDGKTTTADEVRGPSIKGGKPQRLAKGDVLIVPQGVPHQFTAVDAPFLYFVVKASGDAGARK
jgi:mannose-6-phosphate isomerase-like protein (cupin superfamily)